MEFVAWSTHKYVMHGFLWKWHKDHHRLDGNKYKSEIAEEKRFEKNDLFFLVFALPAVILMITGLTFSYYQLFMSALASPYMDLPICMIHDIIIHKRIKIPFLQNNQNFLIKAILKAHMAHHMPKTRDDFHNYGLLIFPWRFLKK